MQSIITQAVSPVLTYFSPVTTILLVVFVIYYVQFKLRRRRLEYLISKVPGPNPLPIIGNVLEVASGYDGKKVSIFCISFQGLSKN